MTKATRAKGGTKKAAAEKPLSARARAFVDQYLIDKNATRAAIRAGYSERTAATQGARLLKDPRIAAAIEKALAEQSARTKISADRVLEELWSIATANANEIVEYRRTCCRYCWGKAHGWQFTARELAAERAMFALRKNPRPTDVFDEKGGDGWDARKDPHPACPECFGEGVPSEFFKDTRHLSKDALRLYGGVKITKGGIEIITHNKMVALDKLARHFGLLKDKPDDDADLDDDDIADIERRVMGLLQTAAARKRAREAGGEVAA